jgi:hypothetical protein
MSGQGTMPITGNAPGPARLLVGDAGIAFLLLNEARHRIVGRVFGVSRKDSNVVTAVTVGLMAGGLATGAARVRSVRMRPSAAEAAMGAVALKETAHGIAGEWSRGTPLFAGLIALVVVEKSFGPALRGAFRAVLEVIRAVRASLRRTRAFLGGR